MVPAVSPVGTFGAVVSDIVYVPGEVTAYTLEALDASTKADVLAKVTDVLPVARALNVTEATIWSPVKDVLDFARAIVTLPDPPVLVALRSNALDEVSVLTYCSLVWS